MPATRAAGPSLRLKHGRDRSLKLRHPWIFSGAVAGVDGAPASGDTVPVIGDDGKLLGQAAYSPSSQIRARVWTFDALECVDAAFFARRVAMAIAARDGMLDADHTGCRLIHGESDGLPGVIADRYGETIVMQLSSAGAERWRDSIVEALAAQPGVICVYERSDADVRTIEGLAPRNGVASGTLPDTVSLVEAGLRYEVDVAAGQKTGFYLDQRDSRAAVRALAAGRETLNMFCYTGGFTLAALAGGASRVLSVDSSSGALALARANLARNAMLPAERAEWRDADAFAELRKLRDAGASFDLVVLDPPKFAPTAQHAERASRAYKDINLWALKLLRPGGLLATFSCSSGVDAGLFRKIVGGAALDAGADAAVIGRFGPSADHPAALAFPEGDYLKGLLIRKSA
ncbi:MAG: class I SAM-dependent rRNA methyltransferase [Aromatoleum sp.]|nr:class I SAM-dependent rRNA methyltransferase [Aromatoleum sp.]